MNEIKQLFRAVFIFQYFELKKNSPEVMKYIHRLILMHK